MRLSLALVVPLLACSTVADAAPKELGDVKWRRNYDAALAEAKKTDKPLLILFDEVPGCSNCVRYGQVVLRHPLIVEAAETSFVPVAVYNNVGGRDRQVLDQYKEPTWNNPVVRIVDSDESALAPRVAGDYSRAGLVRAMMIALQRKQKPVPEYLTTVAAELIVPRTETAVFAMYCFWSGEVCLGGVDGVVRSRTGFLAGAEVVEVTFDPARVSFEKLVAAAKSNNCASRVFVKNESQALIASKYFEKKVLIVTSAIKPSGKDDKYQLRHTAWRYVPMTPLQATLANTIVGRGRDPSNIFSPRQQKIFGAAKKKRGAREVMFMDDLVAAFAAVR